MQKSEIYAFVENLIGNVDWNCYEDDVIIVT